MREGKESGACATASGQRARDLKIDLNGYRGKGIPRESEAREQNDVKLTPEAATAAYRNGRWKK